MKKNKNKTLSPQFPLPKIEQTKTKQVLPFTETLEVVPPEAHAKWPVYRVMDVDGSIREGATGNPGLTKEEVRKMYKTMCTLRQMDEIFYNAQRQGRISFYMTCSGEEAIHIGSSAALADDDMVFAQYREAGVLMWRGFTLQQFADQCFSNEGDPAKGRQMPVHYGSRELHYQTISSPLATQIPQAAGAAYACKGTDKMVACYFGEGAASEGDFHAALNFAATLECPVMFFCRNNGFAISTPVEDQFRGDGIASRGAGYGMHTIRVDGNDLLAVYAAVKEARAVAVRESKPVLVEAMTYRQGHHSTSDDSTRYREVSEIRAWQESDDPVARVRAHMDLNGWWSDAEEDKMKEELRADMMLALETAEKKPMPPLDGLFEDVYDDVPIHLQEQQAAMYDHISKYPAEYSTAGDH